MAVELLRPSDVENLSVAVASRRGVGTIARGMGRSYGDAAQLTGGVAIDMTLLKGFELDPSRRTVTAYAGVTIGELLRRGGSARAGSCRSSPGTQHVTVGGAIASDIHGKNHGTAGTFGSHVRGAGAADAPIGELHSSNPAPRDGLFEATLGGMGLTGVIVWSRIALRELDGPHARGRHRSGRESRRGAGAALGPGRVAPGRVARPARAGGRVGGSSRGPSTSPGAPAQGGPTVAARATVPEHWPAMAAATRDRCRVQRASASGARRERSEAGSSGLRSAYVPARRARRLAAAVRQARVSPVPARRPQASETTSW